LSQLKKIKEERDEQEKEIQRQSSQLKKLEGRKNHEQTLYFLSLLSLYDLEYTDVLGNPSSEGFVCRVKITSTPSVNEARKLNPKISTMIENVEYAIKIYFNYYGSKTKTLRKHHAKDLRLLFAIEPHPNVLHGLTHFKESLNEDFFEDYLPQKLSQSMPVIKEKLPYKVQAVLLPLMRYINTNDTISQRFINFG